MPALNPVSKVLRIDLFFSKGNQGRVRDRIFMQYAGAGPTPADLTTFLTTMATAWGNNLSGNQTTDTTLFQLEATDLTSATGAQQFLTTSKVGTIATGNTSAGVAAVVKFKTARRYRGGHPRFYLTGVAAANIATATQLQAAYAAAIATNFAAFIAAAVTGPPASMGATSHVNVSYFQGFSVFAPVGKRARNVPQPRGVPLVDPIISYSANPNVASQRRRNAQSA